MDLLPQNGPALILFPSIRPRASWRTDFTALVATRDVHRVRFVDTWLAILVNSAWMLLAVPIGLVLVDRIIITREERYLERKFGEEYLHYRRRVRRWL